MQGEAEGDVEACRRGMGRLRRVMWRQADNPLAPRDKYEVRRTFSQPPGPPSAVESPASPAERRQRERERERERERGREGGRAAPSSPPGKSLSHQIMAAADRLSRTAPIRAPCRYVAGIRYFFSSLARHRGVAQKRERESERERERERERESWNPLELRRAWVPFGGWARASSRLFIWPIFPGEMYAGLSGSDANIRDFETE